MTRTLIFLFRAGGELGLGEIRERNCRDTPSLLPRNDILKFFFCAIISHGKVAVVSSTSSVRFTALSVRLLKSSGITMSAKNRPSLSRLASEMPAAVMRLDSAPNRYELISCSRTDTVAVSDNAENSNRPVTPIVSSAPDLGSAGGADKSFLVARIKLTGTSGSVSTAVASGLASGATASPRETVSSSPSIRAPLPPIKFSFRSISSDALICCSFCSSDSMSKTDRGFAAAWRRSACRSWTTLAITRKRS